MLADCDVLSMALPAFQAPIQELDVDCRLIDPPDHVSQLAHCTLAVMVWPSSDTPLPASSVSWAAVDDVSSVGMVWKVPRRGDSVMLPAPSWYMRKMLEPDILLPVPRATHAYEAGAVIWK
jgi:hypothetical protein